MVFTTGMRASTPSPRCTRRWPMIFAANRPLRNNTSNVRTTPRPGILNPSHVLGCNDSGSSSNVLSMVVTIRFKTHSVMTSGTQISKPVMKYFLTARELPFHGAASCDGLALAPLSAAGLLVSEGFALSSALAFAPSAFDSSVALGLEPLFLKSVAYQPLPFSWKPAAETSLAMVGRPQLSQSVTAGSESFCRYSFSKPQAVQRYS